MIAAAKYHDCDSCGMEFAYHDLNELCCPGCGHWHDHPGSETEPEPVDPAVVAQVAAAAGITPEQAAQVVRYYQYYIAELN